MARGLFSLLLCAASMLLFLTDHQASSEVMLSAKPDDDMFGTTEGSLRPEECAPRCTTRCSVTSFKKPCMFFCQKCCAKCLCVPPGTYGNKQVCPCYDNWKTKRGGPKCP